MRIKGTGSEQITVYGGEYNPAGGTESTVNLNSTDSFVDIYGGYYDGEGVNVTNNIVNVAGWFMMIRKRYRIALITINW